MENLDKLKEIAIEVGVLPIDTSKNTSHTIIMDISGLPKEYKNLEIKEAVRRYQMDFGIKIIPVDFSKSNTQGSQQEPRIIILN